MRNIFLVVELILVGGGLVSLLGNNFRLGVGALLLSVFIYFLIPRSSYAAASNIQVSKAFSPYIIEFGWLLIILSPLLFLYSIGEGLGGHSDFGKILGFSFIVPIIGIVFLVVGKSSNTK